LELRLFQFRHLRGGAGLETEWHVRVLTVRASGAVRSMSRELPVLGSHRARRPTRTVYGGGSGHGEIYGHGITVATVDQVIGTRVRLVDVRGEPHGDDAG
jgi:hypothetical protein